jgi:hypothetical protein
MLTLTRAAALSTLVLALTAGSAAAQHAQTREGFFVGFGMGYGSLDVTCSSCDVDREGGLSGYLNLGTAVRPNLLLGVETDTWYKNEDGGSLTVGNLSAAAYWYPKTETGFYLKGGVGLSGQRLAVDGVGSETETGLGLLAGLGYDWRLGPNTSITPTANFLWGDLDGGSLNVVQLGVGVTFH